MRTHFYMPDRYELKLSKRQKRLLQTWDSSDPIDTWESQRNKKIKAIQNNENPFIK